MRFNLDKLNQVDFCLFVFVLQAIEYDSMGDKVLNAQVKPAK